MNVLIVEDDENKCLQLQAFLHSAFPQAQASVARSLQGGLRRIIAGGQNIVLLDMTMPTYDIGIDEDGGRPQSYAGREILRQLERRGIHLPVIVVTQFDRFGDGAEALTLEQLDSQLKKEHPHNYKGSVYYKPGLEAWKNALRDMINLVCQEMEANEHGENPDR